MMAFHAAYLPFSDIPLLRRPSLFEYSRGTNGLLAVQALKNKPIEFLSSMDHTDTTVR